MFEIYTQQVVALYPSIFGAALLCLAVITAVTPFVTDKEGILETVDSSQGFLLLVTFWPIIPPLAFLIVICLAGFAVIGLTNQAACHIRSSDTLRQIIKHIQNNT